MSESRALKVLLIGEDSRTTGMLEEILGVPGHLVTRVDSDRLSVCNAVEVAFDAIVIEAGGIRDIVDFAKDIQSLWREHVGVVVLISYNLDVDSRKLLDDRQIHFLAMPYRMQMILDAVTDAAKRTTNEPASVMGK